MIPTHVATGLGMDLRGLVVGCLMAFRGKFEVPIGAV
jgi:hypothetical protein